MTKRVNRYRSGFTIIELLVTLFVASIFLIAGYQIYITVIRVDGQTKAQVVAQNTAEDYLNRYRALVPSPCVASQPLNNQAVTVSGLANATIAVTVSCPKSSSISTLSKIDVVLKYGNQNPQQQIAYSAWSYSQDVCGQGWILVPGDSRFDTPNFCVMKYEAKNVNGQAVSQAAGTPWVNISQNDAIKVSAAACPICHLITESEWMTIAANVLSVPSNWSGGAVGSGAVYRGQSETTNDASNALAASADDSNGYYGIGSTSSTNTRRTLTLSNGEVVWDLAGNVWEYTNATTAGGKPGTGAGYAWRQWTDSGLNLTGSTLPVTSRPSAISTQAASWNGAQGIGLVFSDASNTDRRGYLRGGHYSDGTNAGVLALNIGPALTLPDSSVGFRVAKSVSAQAEQFAQPASCPTGFIPVPGDARFGTAGFCVMKFEAKNDGSGKAISVAAGAPWTNISWNDAVTTSTAACSGCHLITDPEWMTIAANVLSVPSNWSGSMVGSGYVYQGHSDTDPNNPLSASTDDSNGYYGTNNTSGNQRRTLALTNGEIIWDFAGNVWEDVNAIIAANQQPGLFGETLFAFKEWNNASMLWGGFPVISRPNSISAQATAWTYANGLGQIYSNYGSSVDNVYVRGGDWGATSMAGVLDLYLDGVPTFSSAHRGFRVAR